MSFLYSLHFAYRWLPDSPKKKENRGTKKYFNKGIIMPIKQVLINQVKEGINLLLNLISFLNYYFWFFFYVQFNCAFNTNILFV